MRPHEEQSSPFCQEVQDEVHAMFRCQFAPVTELRQLFSVLFENVPQNSDDLHKFIDPTNALLWRPSFLSC